MRNRTHMIQIAKEPAPYGEARRIRYLLRICKELTAFSTSVDMGLFLERIVISCELLNQALKKYVRETGILNSVPVARNYVRFCNWLKLVQIEGRFIVPNGYTVFIGNIESRDDFVLTNDEKIAFFLIAVEKEEVRRLIRDLQPISRIRQHTERISEHFVETFFEWFVDLGILKPSSRKFGYFTLTQIGSALVEALKLTDDVATVSSCYASQLLGTKVHADSNITDQEFESLLNNSILRLEKYARSELDSSLYSALPILLDMQLRGITYHKRFLGLREIMTRLNDLSKKGRILFKWDSMIDKGYIKLKK